jgi:hypothetical protein
MTKPTGAGTSGCGLRIRPPDGILQVRRGVHQPVVRDPVSGLVRNLLGRYRTWTSAQRAGALRDDVVTLSARQVLHRQVRGHAPGALDRGLCRR